MNRYEVYSKYRDSYTKGKWNKKCDIVYAASEYDAIGQVKDINGYGTDPDCEYEIIGCHKV